MPRVDSSTLDSLLYNFMAKNYRRKHIKVITEIIKAGFKFEGWQHRNHRTNGKRKQKTLKQIKLEKKKDKHYKKIKHKVLQK